MKNLKIVAIACLILMNFSFAAANSRFTTETPECSFTTYLKSLVLREAKQSEIAKTNTFSVSTLKTTRPDGEYWVLWHEKKRLFLIYWPVSYKEECKQGRTGRRDLDLTKDVVKTADDIKGSTYLVDEKWASQVVFDAIIHGPSFSISK